MNSQIKERWVRALRSGEYEQTTRCLHNDKGFCCLGVLCDLYAKEHNVSWNRNSITQKYDLFHSDQVLPPEVMEWARVERDPTVKHASRGATTLAMLNDHSLDFNQIAQIIEEQL